MLCIEHAPNDTKVSSFAANNLCKTSITMKENWIESIFNTGNLYEFSRYYHEFLRRFLLI